LTFLEIDPLGVFVAPQQSPNTQGSAWHAHNEHIDEPGDVVFRHACKVGLECIVSRRLGSPYRSGRSRQW